MLGLILPRISGQCHKRTFQEIQNLKKMIEWRTIGFTKQWITATASQPKDIRNTLILCGSTSNVPSQHQDAVDHERSHMSNSYAHGWCLWGRHCQCWLSLTHLEKKHLTKVFFLGGWYDNLYILLILIILLYILYIMYILWRSLKRRIQDSSKPKASTFGLAMANSFNMFQAAVSA